MSSSPTPTDPERGEGKGSNDDDDDDPAEDFEDDPDSEAAADAQQTLDEIDAEVTTSEGDESESPSAAESGTSDVGESGRNGLASDPEVLQSPFEHAETRETARDAGIDEGNTTADDMEVLEMEDGSRVFATSISAYPNELVDSQEEAINNNLRSPQIINALGGDACKASITEDSDGNTFIVREGVEGELPKNMDSVGDATATSIEDTIAATYFVGNGDLISGNTIVDAEGNLNVIDHDHHGGLSTTGMISVDDYADGEFSLASEIGNVDSQSVKNKIYDNAHQITSGEQEIPVPEDTPHHNYAHKAAKRAVRKSYFDDSYDAPDDNKPPEIQDSPDGYNTIADFGTDSSVQVVDDDGAIVEGRITLATDKAVVVKPNGEYGSKYSSNITINEHTLNRVVEIDGSKSQ